jgi:hypothetical protein
MDDRQKTRLVMLGISGVLALTGYYGYVWYQDQKAAQLEEEQVPIANVRQPVRSKPVETVANNTTTDATAGTVKPAVDVTATKTPVEPAVTPPVATPVAKVETPPVVTTPPAVKTPPVVTTPPVVAQAKPPVATTPTPSAVIAVRPPVTAIPPATTAQPAETPPAVVPGATPPVASSAVVINSNGLPPYLATPLEVAVAAAAQGKGRPEPTRPIDRFEPWPTAKGAGSMLAQGKTDPSALLALVPPPPPPEKPVKPKKINEKLVPPPPPAEVTGAGGGLAGLPIDQLPVPPSRPTIGDKLKVLSVFDDRAIIAFPKALQIKNKWPRTISLGTGEEFESLKIVSVNRDGVTIEEDGERSMKPISAVK